MALTAAHVVDNGELAYDTIQLRVRYVGSRGILGTTRRVSRRVIAEGIDTQAWVLADTLRALGLAHLHPDSDWVTEPAHVGPEQILGSGDGPRWVNVTLKRIDGMGEAWHYRGKGGGDLALSRIDLDDEPA